MSKARISRAFLMFEGTRMKDERERLFVREYVINKGNAYQAALKAGYAKWTAKHAYQWIEETKPNPTEKRKLSYKPHLKKAIDEMTRQILSEKTADAQEVMEYLTSVLRGESSSEVVMVVGTGDGCSEIAKVQKSPDEKDRLKAADSLIKILNMTQTQGINVSVEPVIIVDDMKDDD